MEINIEDLLRRAVSLGATDLHLKVGSPPVALASTVTWRGSKASRRSNPRTRRPTQRRSSPRGALAIFKDTGTADFAFGRQDIGRFRVTAFRQRGSVSVVLRRVFPGTMSFTDLGLPRVVEKLAAETSGLLLVTGASGSGKTSTMASILDWINTHRAVSILTVEDPIEVLHPDKKSVVEQHEVGVDTPSAADAVRSAMRHDNDVLMISEFDDAETARAAIAGGRDRPPGDLLDADD